MVGASRRDGEASERESDGGIEGGTPELVVTRPRRLYARGGSLSANLPSAVRDFLGLSEGDRIVFAFDQSENRVWIERAGDTYMDDLIEAARSRGLSISLAASSDQEEHV